MESAGTKVYVGNCEGLSEGELRDEFSHFGHLENVWIARNPPGFAFVWYTDERDARDAVASMEGKSLAGKTLRVEVSHNRGGRREGGDRDRDDRGDRGGDRDRGDRGGSDRYGGGGGGDRYGSSGDRYGGGGGGGYGGGGGGYRGPPPASRGGPPRKTGFKVRLSNLPHNTHWTELKDAMRKVGEVIYANVEGDEGIAEFADREGMERAQREYDDTNFGGGSGRIRVDIQDESDRYRRVDSRSPPPRGGRDRSPYGGGGYGGGRGRSRSPPPRRRSRSPPPRRRSRSRSRSPRRY